MERLNPHPLNPPRPREPWFIRGRTAWTGIAPLALFIVSGVTASQSRWEIAGVALVFAGQMLRAWAAGCLLKNHELMTAGPFAWTRNPLYLGSGIIGLGYVLLSGVAWSLLPLLAAFTVIYLPTIRYEEARLRELFGDRLNDYFARVPRFFPRWPGRPTLGPFRWTTLVRNREWEAALANTAGSLLFLLT